VQTFIDIHSGNWRDASELLHRLREVAPNDFYALTARLEYCAARGDEQQLTTTFEKARRLAMTTARRASLLNRMGYHYLQLGRFDDSLQAYRQLANLTPGDPSVWHHMSVNHLAKKELVNARHCNKIALRLTESESARRVQRKIRTTAARMVSEKTLRALIYVALFFIPWVFLAIAAQLV
jgi:Flp pilus assembly protein TadD